MPLTDRDCRAAKSATKIWKMFDGGGLALWVYPNGTKKWRLSYRYFGKPKSISFGSYPLVSLASARESRDDAKRILLAGDDPMQKRRAAKADQAALATFSAIASEYRFKLAREGRAARTLEKHDWLIDLAGSKFGQRAITGIRAPDVLEVLMPIQARGHYESARRLKTKIGSIVRFAIASGRAELDPTSALTGFLTAPAPKPHAAILEWQAFGGLLRAIESFEGQPTTRYALQLLSLMFTRPGELRLAGWDEFDLTRAIWTIPATRMKMRRAHQVPLARQSLEILASLRALRLGGGFLFPGLRSWERPISENTLNAGLRRLGYSKDEATSHGFRATASTLLNESGVWNSDAIERQLAHLDRNPIRAIYARGQHWDERVRMMQWWADALDDVRRSSAR